MSTAVKTLRTNSAEAGVKVGSSCPPSVCAGGLEASCATAFGPDGVAVADVVSAAAAFTGEATLALGACFGFAASGAAGVCLAVCPASEAACDGAAACCGNTAASSMLWTGAATLGGTAAPVESSTQASSVARQEVRIE